MVLSGLGLCMSILAAHGYSISDSFIGLAVISLVETWLLGCFSFFDYLLKFDYFVDLHIVKKCGGHDKRFANALRHRWCFSSVVQQRRSFSRKQVECLTHIRRAWRPGKQFAIWLSSGV